MKIEYKFEIKDPNRLLILEINDRVKNAIDTLKNGHNLSNADIEILKIDKSSLIDYDGGYERIMATNLTKKIDLIIKGSEKQ